MKESSKTINIRALVPLEKFLQGRVIDMGAGNDLICPSAEGVDVSQGDANYITKFRPVGAYDAVCSSYCLEHMFNPVDALAEWRVLVKPRGYLLLTVRDEDLYEQGFFPCRFNTVRKATFRFRTLQSWNPVSHEIEGMVSSLPGARIVAAEVQSDIYDHSLRFKFGGRVGSSIVLSRI